MSETSGIDPQILTLPKGGGAVSDLGETFDVDLNTGTGSFALALALPSGPNGIGPRLNLRYHSAAGNGPFGIGWTFGELCVARNTEASIPTYAPGEESFVIPGVDELVAVGDGLYRPRVDTMMYRTRRSGEGWELTDTRGTVYLLGQSSNARVEDTSGPEPRTAMWLLSSTTDSGSEAVLYEYLAEGAQRYLQHISWGTYRLDFVYEPRPDRLVSGRNGFLLETNLRCALVELHVLGEEASLIRSWKLDYAQAPGSGLSLLEQVTLRGHAEDGSIEAAPPARLGYSQAAPCSLGRVQGEWPGMRPERFSNGNVELVDWNGDGLPDAMEMHRGAARIWPNRGRLSFGVPEALSTLPGPLSLDAPGVAFADMDGNGTADLLQASGSLARYTPIKPGGGFERPVTLEHTPTATLARKDSRLVDLNGDGITDLLETGEDWFTLYYRSEDGWSQMPQTIAREEAPPVSLSDPHTFLADMSGDGLQDLVRVDGAGVRYWPYLGYGRWAEAIVLEDPPTLPRSFDPRRVFLTDVDGDGCADIVYAGAGTVTVWLNQGGRRIGEPTTISCTPTVPVKNIRLCDFNGTGTAGLLYADVPCGPVERAFVYLDLSGGVKPYLLERIDNGLGLQTTIGYRSSTEYALDDAAAGSPWLTFHPFPVQCVSGISITDATSGESTATSHRYHQGRYDYLNKTFLGFEVVDSVTAGDDSIPGQRVRNTYNVGLDPSDPERPLSAEESLTFGALRQRLLKTEIFGLDGGPLEAKPYRVVEHDYDARIETGSNGASISVGFETQTRDSNYERMDTPFSVRTIEYLEYDVHGNCTKQRMRAQRSEAPTPDQEIATEITFAKNEASWIVSLPARVVQTDAGGEVVSTKVTTYDGPAHVGLPEGQVEVGFTTSVEVLALTDALAASVYGASLPDMAALGYHRRPGEEGWWVTACSYERITGPPLTLVTRNSRGFDSRVEYDPTGQFPVRMVDALGGVTTVTIDPRAMQADSLTEENGVKTLDTFDALDRVTATIASGDSAALPSSTYAYQTEQLPCSLTTAIRVEHGKPETLDQTEYFDGRGRVLCSLLPGGAVADGGLIVSGVRSFNSRGFVSEAYVPFVSAERRHEPPPAGTAKTTTSYDAIGRVLEQNDASGARSSIAYAPGAITISEALVVGGTPRVRTERSDALGRVVAVERTLNGRAITVSHEYDSANRMVAAHDPDGGTTRFVFDQLGRMLVEESLDTGRTVFVIDARGNQLERHPAAGPGTRYTVDALDRVTAEYRSDGPTPDVSYTYLNPGDPSPPDGDRNRRTRLWRVEDPIGSLVLAYDERGQTVQSARTITALGREFVTDFELDAAGRMVQVKLPEAQAGAGRRVLSYTYDERGLPTSIPGYVRSASFDIGGRLVSYEQQNGVVNEVDFLANSKLPSRLRVTGPDGTSLRDLGFHYDGAGNTTAIDSPLDIESATFTYDGLDRLTAASYGNGDKFGYAYTDGGSIRQIEGLGEITLRPGGSGQLEQAGGDSYQFDAAGRLQSGPYGELQWDGLDRLTEIQMSEGRKETYAYDHAGSRVYHRTAEGKESYVVSPSLEIVDGEPLLWVTLLGRRVLALSGATPLYAHYDQLGQATLFTDAAGNLASRLSLGPYGTLRAQSGAGPPEEMRFGGRFDAATGLVCMGLRYYDPRLGRFISPDMVVGALALDGWNRYAFARENPLRYIDPTGLSVWDVLAIIGVVIVVAALIVAAVFTAGATLPFAFGITVSVSGLLTATAIGVAGGALIGGIAAAQAGAEIWKGILFGALVGGVSAFAGGYLSAGVFGLMGGAANAGILGNLVAGAIQGSIVGAGSGAAVGFAGGKGSVEQVFKHMFEGFVTGAITGALMGLFFGGFNATNKEGSGGLLKIGTLDKFDPNWPANGDVMAKLNYMDNAGSTAQDTINWAQNGVHALPNGVTEFIFTDANGPQTFTSIFAGNSNDALLSIPMGWVPSVFVPYGGMAALEDFSMTLDETGLYSWDKQLMMLLNAAPFIGIVVGYGIGEGTKVETTAQNWVHENFSQNP